MPRLVPHLVPQNWARIGVKNRCIAVRYSWLMMLPELEIFYVGRHTDSSGNTRDWTHDDVQRIADHYNAQSDHEAPAVIGHPKEDKPAYGYAERLRFDEQSGKLYATWKLMKEGFVRVVKEGHFLKRSIALYPNGLLKHVGFLGAVPPALKGMADPGPSYRDDDDGALYIEFSGESISTTNQGSMDEQQAQQLTELIKGVQGSIETIGARLTVIEAKVGITTTEEGAPTTDEEKSGGSDSGFSEKKNEGTITENETALRSENAVLKRKLRLQEYHEFLGGEGLRTRVTPAMKETVVGIMDILADTGAYQFSEAVEKVPFDAFKEFLGSLPEQYAEGELAVPDNATTPDATTTKEIDDLAKYTSRRS